MNDHVFSLLPVRRGHFRLESGHHGDVWVDLELLCLRPESVRRLAAMLATEVARENVEAVCGPLVEGAFVALMIAETLRVPFTYAQPISERNDEELYPIAYRIPPGLRILLRGKRVGIVNDVINAGSAVLGTFNDLRDCGAEPVTVATLAVLGDWAAAFAARENMSLHTLRSLPNEIWQPSDCPLCRRGVPLSDTAM